MENNQSQIAINEEDELPSSGVVANPEQLECEEIVDSETDVEGEHFKVS